MLKSWKKVSFVFLSSYLHVNVTAVSLGSPQVVNGSSLTTGDISQCIMGKRMSHLFIREQKHSRTLFKENGRHHTGCRRRKYLFIWDAVLEIMLLAWIQWILTCFIAELLSCFYKFITLHEILQSVVLNSSSLERSLTNSRCSVQIVLYAKGKLVCWCSVQT